MSDENTPARPAQTNSPTDKAHHRVIPADLKKNIEIPGIMQGCGIDINDAISCPA